MLSHPGYRPPTLLIVASEGTSTIPLKLIVDSEGRGTTPLKLIVDSEVRGTTPLKLIMDDESEKVKSESDAFLVLYFFSISDILKGGLWVTTTLI